MGEVHVVISFDLMPECENHEEVKAPDTIGKVIVRPKKATLQRDTNTFFGTMQPVCLVKLGSDT